MTAFHTPLQNTPDNIEAILVALQLKAQRQIEVFVANDQDSKLLMLCRLILDTQAVQEKRSDDKLGSRKKGIHAEDHYDD